MRLTKQDVAKLSRIEARLVVLQRRLESGATAIAMKSKTAAVSALTQDGPRRMPAGEYKRLASRLLTPEPARPRREQQTTDSDNRLSESSRR